ncbi:glycosyltransferase 87 family protein [Streptomyces sp. NPDC056112]|uniref:glycosyltransferase family 87 protein n=1 Tax=unclassified Streptomyces TaxID=2593676 RepID=UPI001CD38B2C|nr:glycosyltransferase family 87 protein [Streptomyces sp. CoT10]
MSAFQSVTRLLTRPSTRHRLLALTAAWLLTRALMLWLLAHNGLPRLGRGSVAREVWKLYQHWYVLLSHGAFPAHDTLWQYPPGAGPVLLSPALLPGLTYFQAFVVLTVAVDALVTLALTHAGTRPGRSLRGAGYWTLGLPLLLHIPLARYDVQATALAVLSLLAMSRSTRACGALAALGALVKVWPALALVGLPRGRATRSAWTWAAVTGAVALSVLACLFRNPLAFARQQGGRGVQIESFGGTALALATHAGWPGRVRYRYGALEFTGPYVSTVAHLSLFLSASAFGLLLLWRIRARHWTVATPYDAALSAVLLFTVTSRVISPQYMVWLLGLAAVCLTSPLTTQRPVAALIAPASLVSVIAYPTLYHQVVACSWTGCALMLTRNGLLAAAALFSFARLWRSTKSVTPDGEPGSDIHRLPHGTLSPS